MSDSERSASRWLASRWRSVPPSARPLVSTALIVAVGLVAILGFNALSGRLSQNGGASLASGAASPTASDQGVLLGGAAAPDFTLQDQTGATVTLASLKGRPTVFTFFDSVCPHTDCSLMAQYINVAAQSAGASANQVNWVALSLNPWHDTQQTASAFLKNQNVRLPLRYLLGSQAQLQPLWDAFHMQSILQSDGIVIHTTGVYLLDSQGHEQVFMDEGFNPRTLARDITLLLRDGASAFAGQQGAQSAHATTLTHGVNGMLVTLTATPGSYGSYNFSVVVESADGAAAIPNLTVTLDLAMPSMAMTPIHVALKPVQPASTGAYRADGVLSMKGTWAAQVTISRPGATASSMTTFIFDATY
ncbi:MAG TPA: SCO family protein [Ktedonobacterales bacterium]